MNRWAWVSRGGHDGSVHAVRAKQVDALRPHLGGLAHRHPDIGVHELRAVYALRDVVGEHDPRTRGERVGARDLLHVGGGPEALRRHDANVGAHHRAHDEQGVAHVGAGVAEVGVPKRHERVGGVLTHREEVGEHLRGMPLVGEPVVHGNVGVLRQLLDDGLGRTPVFDRVEHARQHARCVGGGLLVADLAAGRIEDGDVTALVARMATSKLTRVRVDVFSKIAASCRPARRCFSLPSRFAALRSAARSRSASSSPGVKSDSLRKSRPESVIAER
jgi:hypothetical protein